MREEIVELRSVVYEVKGEQKLLRALRGITKAGDEVEVELGQVGQRAERAQRALHAMGQTGARALGSLARTGRQAAAGLALAGAASAALFTKAAIGIAAQRDATQKGFAALLKSEKEALRVLERIRKVSLKPGVTRDSGEKLALSLIAVRINADVAVDSIEQFGNALALAGRGEAELERVGVALSQIISKGKVSAEEINQLAESVPQIRDVMNSVFGTADTEKLQKEMAAAGISAQQFVTLLVKGFGELERANPNTLSNSLTNLKAAAIDAAGAFGAAFAAPESIEGIQAITKAVEGLAPLFSQAGQMVASTFPAIADWIARTFNIENLTSWGQAVAKAFRYFDTGLGETREAIAMWREQFVITISALPEIARAGFADLRVAALAELQLLVDQALVELQPLIALLDRLPNSATRGGGMGTPTMSKPAVAPQGVAETSNFWKKAARWGVARMPVGQRAIEAMNPDAPALGELKKQRAKKAALDGVGKAAVAGARAVQLDASATGQLAQAIAVLNTALSQAEARYHQRIAQLRAEQEKLAASTAGTAAHTEAVDAETQAVVKQNTARREYLALLAEQTRLTALALEQAKAQARTAALAGIRADDALTSGGRGEGITQGRRAAETAMGAARRRQAQLPPAGDANASKAQLRELFVEELGKALPDVKALQQAIRENEAYAATLKAAAEGAGAEKAGLLAAADAEMEKARAAQLRMDGLTAGFEAYTGMVESGMQRNMEVTAAWLDFTQERLEKIVSQFGHSTDDLLATIVGKLGERGELSRSLGEMVTAGQGKSLYANTLRYMLQQIDAELARYGVTGGGGSFKLPAGFEGAVSRAKGEARDPRSIAIQMQGSQQAPGQRDSMNDRLTASALGNLGMGSEMMLADARLKAQGRIVADAMTSAMMPMTRVIVEAFKQASERTRRSIQTQLAAAEASI